MKVIFLLISYFLLLPSQNLGLREIKVGDKIPNLDQFNISIDKVKKVILILKSDDVKSINFFKKFAPTMNKDNEILFYLVDANPTPDTRVLNVYQDLKVKKALINDSERKIYGRLGVIVLPTLLYINQDNTLHSLVAGYRANLTIFFKEYMRALLDGEPPKDVYESTDHSLQQRKISKGLKQAFLLLVNENFDLSYTIYQKILLLDNQNIETILGVGYTLLYKGKIKESFEFFNQERVKNSNRRILLGYYLLKSLIEPDDDTFKKIANLSLVEPQYFFIIFKVAEILDKAGRVDLSKMVYKHSYKVLLRYYRRNK